MKKQKQKKPMVLKITARKVIRLMKGNKKNE